MLHYHQTEYIYLLKWSTTLSRTKGWTTTFSTAKSGILSTLKQKYLFAKMKETLSWIAEEKLLLLAADEACISASGLFFFLLWLEVAGRTTPSCVVECRQFIRCNDTIEPLEDRFMLDYATRQLYTLQYGQKVVHTWPLLFFLLLLLFWLLLFGVGFFFKLKIHFTRGSTVV